MALSVANTSQIRSGKGLLYLADYPASMAGGTLTLKANGYYALFYQDGVKRKALTAGVTPWATLTADGFSLKVKQEQVKFDPNNAAEFIVGIKDTNVSAEFSFGEVTAAKLSECLSSASDTILTTLTGSAQAGRTTVAIGAEGTVKYYTALYVVESKTVPGEFDNYLIPKINFEPDFDISLKKGDALKLKVKAIANPDSNGMVAANGLPVFALVDTATAPGF